MLKLEVYNPSAPEPEPEPVRLSLHQEGSIVRLFVVDVSGRRVDQGSLLTFHTDGTITRHTGVNPDLGFQLDEDGCIVVEDE